MSINNERYPLQETVLQDLFANNKVLLALLIAIVITALGTVWITHQTRLLIAEKGELVFEKQALENEYLNFKLEETTQSDNTRIEAIATSKLGMEQVHSEREVILVE